MSDINETINSYRESCRLIRERITWLNEKIAEAAKGEDQQAQTLSERRYLLYSQLWEMERSIRAMESYLDAVERKKEVFPNCG